MITICKNSETLIDSVDHDFDYAIRERAAESIDYGDLATLAGDSEFDVSIDFREWHGGLSRSNGKSPQPRTTVPKFHRSRKAVFEPQLLEAFLRYTIRLARRHLKCLAPLTLGKSECTRLTSLHKTVFRIRRTEMQTELP